MIDDGEIQGVRDRVLMLRSLNTLSGLPDTDLSVLAERMRLRRFDKGDVLFTEEDSIDAVYFILEGEVLIERAGMTKGRLHRGTVAGFYAVLAGDNRSVHATVQRPVKAFELSVDVLYRAFNRFPALVRHFIHLSGAALLASRGQLPIDDKDEDFVCRPPTTRDRTFAERILAFSHSASVLRDTSLAALFEIVLQAEEVRIPAGETLWEEGDASTTMLRIDEGRVRCTCEAGGESLLCAPYLLGELETYAHVPRPYTAVVEADLLALRIHRETAYSVLESNPSVGMALLSRLARDMLAYGWAGLGDYEQAA